MRPRSGGGGRGLRRLRRVLGHPTYGIYAAGNSVSLLGTWTQRVAVGWLAWDLTGQATWLGIVAFADLFPIVLIGPFAGVVADRVERLRIVQWTHSLALIQAVVLWLCTVAGWITPALLTALVAVGGVLMAFNQPARMAVVPSLVPPDLMGSAVALNSVIFNLARFMGPALAGVCIVWSGVAAAFAFNAVSFVAFLVALVFVRRQVAPVPCADARAESVLAALVDGLRYTARHRTLTPLLVLISALGFGVRPYVELFPGFADAVFGGGPAALATLGSVVGAGAMAGAVWMAQRPTGADLTRVVLVSALIGAAAVAGFALAPTLFLASVAAAVSGVALTISGVGSQTLIHLQVEGRLRARVLSLYGLLLRAGPAFGAVGMGALADSVGFRAPLLGGCAVAAAVWFWLWRRRGAIAAPAPDAVSAAAR